ncbi:Fic family protein [Arthrobacter methylotrophus]|uniref:Fic family protein n=1 Tax=Arthrobacter methylotrophus TaxID=121291 RepID=UPI0031EF51BB
MPFWFSMTDTLLQGSEEIARRASGSIKSQEHVVGSKGRNEYIAKSLVEEAITSSQLEGASTPRRVAKELLESGREPEDKSEIMIVNNYVAMQRIRDAAQSPLTPEFVLELHRFLTEDTLEDPADAGRLETPDHTRVAVWDNDVKLHAPPPAVQLPERLAALCRFANGGSGSAYIPPVVRAVVVHFMVGYDHYFADGNGRTARALFYWTMLNQGYWLSEYVTISKILKTAPSAYAHAYLYTEDDEGDLTYFIHYQLDVFIRALNELDQYLAAKAEEMLEVRTALDSGIDLNRRQIDVLEHLVRDGDKAVTVRSDAARNRVSDETARADLNDLVSRGYLHKSRVSKAFVWKAPPQLAAKLARK